LSRQLLSRTIAPLPYALREQIELYADYLEENVDDWIPNVDAVPKVTLRDEFIFLGGLRRLWSLVSGQYWLLDRALGLSGQLDIRGVSAGSTVFVRGQGTHADLRALREELATEFRRLELSVVTTVRSNEELIEFLIDEHSRGSR
jgi:hypothetical protein